MTVVSSITPAVPHWAGLSSVWLSWAGVWAEAATQWQRNYWQMLAFWHRTAVTIGYETGKAWVAHGCGCLPSDRSAGAACAPATPPALAESRLLAPPA